MGRVKQQPINDVDLLQVLLSERSISQYKLTEGGGQTFQTASVQQQLVLSVFGFCTLVVPVSSVWSW